MMQHDNHPSWQHGHGFRQDQKRPGEVRTIIVIAITGAMMVVEIATGILFGSMALLLRLRKILKRFHPDCNRRMDM